MLAQINPLHFLVVPELGRRAGSEDDSIVDNVGPVGHLKRLADGTFLLTYYARTESKEDVRACRFRVLGWR